MIVRTLTVENLRCFTGETTVGPFAEGLNVLHAPNGTGKSTLFAALRHALFDGNNVSGGAIEALRPWGRSLAPSVTVEFHHQGEEWRVEKRFLDKPAAKLLRLEGGRWQPVAEGREADSRCREILMSSPPGKGIARPENQGLAQVLWVGQGSMALQSVSDDVAANIRGLLQPDAAGNGGPLEGRIEKRYLELFTPTGKPRKGSPLPAAREDFARAEERLRRAVELVQDYEATSRRIRECRDRSEDLRRQREELAEHVRRERARLEEYRRLHAEVKTTSADVERAEAEYGALEERIRHIESARKEIATADDRIRRLEDELGTKREELAGLEKDARRARAALDDVHRRAGEVRVVRERAGRAVRLVEVKKELADLDRRIATIDRIRTHLARLREERARVLAPDRKTLGHIRNALDRQTRLRAALEASMVSVEVTLDEERSVRAVAGEEPGERTLASGEPRVFRGSPEVALELAGVGRVRAFGPEGNVVERREELESVREEIARLTDPFGTADYDELDRRANRAGRLDGDIESEGRRLDDFLCGDNPDALPAEREKLVAAVEEILRREPEWRDADPDAAALRDEAERLETRIGEESRRVERDDRNAATAVSTMKEEIARLAAELDATRKTRDGTRKRLDELEADGRSDEERTEARVRLAMDRDASRKNLEEKSAALERLGEDPAPVVERLEQQLRGLDEEREAASDRESRMEERLEGLAREAPWTAHARAEEDVARLREVVRQEELRADAVRLLWGTVRECRRDLEQSVVAPVERLATRTLRRVAGRDLGDVTLGEGFAPNHVKPPATNGDAPVGIDQVSAGEAEQLHLATRLALAEHLAREERQLVVLDDVLTSTDSARLARIAAILEEHAARLQILILTCHPERYRGLRDAKFIDLEEKLTDPPADTLASPRN